MRQSYEHLTQCGLLGRTSFVVSMDAGCARNRRKLIFWEQFDAKYEHTWYVSKIKNTNFPGSPAGAV